MTVYKRFGTPEQQAEADRMLARIAAAEAEADLARLEVLRRRAEAAERRARVAQAEASGTFMERAQAARDWAVDRWPDSIEQGPARIAAAVREATQYMAEHPGTPRRRSKTLKNDR